MSNAKTPLDVRLETFTKEERVHWAMLPLPFRMAVRELWNKLPEKAEEEFMEWARMQANAKRIR